MSVTAVKQTPDVSHVPYFDPNDYLINVIRRAKANRQNLHISARGFGEIDILGTRGEYVSRCDDLPAVCESPADTLQITVLSSRESWPSASEGRVGSLGELLWEAGFHASKGRLMDGCSPFDVVELSRWPNLTRLSRSANTIRLCALLTRHPTSLIVAGRLLKIGKAELYQFYTAANCAGFAHPVNRPEDDAEPRLEPYRDRTLLAKLVARIAGL